MTPDLNLRRHWLWFCASWVALLGYAGAASPLGAAFTALVAECDPGHHVAFAMNAEGARVALQHQGCSAAHHHGFVARALTAFTPPLQPDEPDHVLQFHSSAPATKPASLPRLVTPDSGQPMVISLAIDSWAMPQVPSATTATVSPPGTPPVFCRRSTALLL
jgi:hypothetical protein